MCKAGLSGDDAPMATFASVVGRPKNNSIMVGMNSNDDKIGDEAIANQSVLKLKYPI
jgi:actin